MIFMAMVGGFQGDIDRCRLDVAAGVVDSRGNTGEFALKAKP